MSTYSAFAVDLAAALGAGDDDLPLAPRHAAHRPAVGAGEILVLLVRPLLLITGSAALDRPPYLLQKAGVLRPALLQIPGEHAVDRDDQQHRGQEADDQVNGLLPDKHIDHIQQKHCPDGGQSQLIRAVASVHETRQRVADFFQKVHTEDRPPAVLSQGVILQEKPAKVKPLYGKFTNWTNLHRASGSLANPHRTVYNRIDIVSAPDEPAEPASSGRTAGSPPAGETGCAFRTDMRPPARFILCRPGTRRAAERKLLHDQDRPLHPIRRLCSSGP